MCKKLQSYELVIKVENHTSRFLAVIPGWPTIIPVIFVDNHLQYSCLSFCKDFYIQLQEKLLVNYLQTTKSKSTLIYCQLSYFHLEPVFIQIASEQAHNREKNMMGMEPRPFQPWVCDGTIDFVTKYAHAAERNEYQFCRSHNVAESVYIPWNLIPQLRGSGMGRSLFIILLRIAFLTTC